MRGRRHRLVWVALLLAAGAVGAQVVEERPVAPGALYRELYRPQGPWAIQVLQIERTAPQLEVGAALGSEYVLGLEPLDRLAERVSTDERYAVAGINGDFYIIQTGPFQGDPIGLCVVDGELISSPVQRSALVVLQDGSLLIERFRLQATLQREDGQTFSLSGVNQECPLGGLVLLTPRFHTATRTPAPAVQLLAGPLQGPLRAEGEYRFTARALLQGDAELILPRDSVALVGRGKGGDFLAGVAVGGTVRCTLKLEPSPGPIRHALGGTPRLLRGGAVSVEAEAEGLSAEFVQARHPRTAIGFNRERLFLVTVDGRQPGYSVGMSLPELAALMQELGATEALNLDGGGSTTMWVRGRVRNRPSDGRVRAIADALLLFSTAPRGPLTRLQLTPPALDLLAGDEAQVRVEGEDEHYNPVNVELSQIQWELSPLLGQVTADGRVTAAPTDAAQISGPLRARVGRVEAFVPVRVHGRVSRLQVKPAALEVGPGETVGLQVTGETEDGQQIPISWRVVQAQVVPSEVGAVGPDGLFRAGPQGQGVVSLRAGGQQVEVTVRIQGGWQVLDALEGSPRWSVRGYPEGVKGNVEFVADPHREGEHALRLSYDFTTTDATRAVYAELNRLIGAPRRLRVWVWGDGNGHWLRARLKDAAGTRFVLDFARRVDWKNEWRQLEAIVPPEAKPPFRWEAFYLAEPDPNKKDAGSIVLDGWEGWFGME